MATDPGHGRRRARHRDPTSDGSTLVVRLRQAWERSRQAAQEREGSCRHDGAGGHECLPCSVFRQLH